MERYPGMGWWRNLLPMLSAGCRPGMHTQPFVPPCPTIHKSVSSPRQKMGCHLLYMRTGASARTYPQRLSCSASFSRGLTAPQGKEGLRLEAFLREGARGPDQTGPRGSPGALFLKSGSSVFCRPPELSSRETGAPSNSTFPSGRSHCAG